MLPFSLVFWSVYSYILSVTQNFPKNGKAEIIDKVVIKINRRF